ncbi:hypothetical protein RDWZM_001854 [Blomia tropicalis]|uniref:Phospholipid/glycerol acyltransferase domain-containing protein n=1 Tax=Blomia tropicalis TaxID=40697 RepID=A0A9Q0MD77_BLOTA|nr:hypothetical protein RDWZM_001854 [Blomia tropicalis]
MVRQRCVNPFFLRINFQDFNILDYLSIILGTIFLFPIRLIATILLFIITSLLARLYTYILSFYDCKKDPETYHRWRVMFKTHLVFLLRTIFFICGFYKVNVIQKGDIEKERDAPIYVYAPHTSLFDILAGLAFNAPASVAKADIIDIPLFGNIFKVSDPVLVERDSKDSRHDVFKKVADTIKFSKIVFFPEGTCSNHRGLLQFKNGAFKFGYPVIPVALRYNQFGGPDSLSWTWDGPSTLMSVWLTLSRWRTYMEITKLPVYYPNKEEKENPDLYAANVTKVLVRELQLPCLFYSFDDARYLKYNFFRSSACIKFLKLSDKIRKLRLDNNEEKNHLSQHKSTESQESTQTTSSFGSRETLFTKFLCKFIDEIETNLSKHDLQTHLDFDLLIKILNINSIPGILKSFSIKEFLYCLNKSVDNEKATLLHLKIVLQLTDLRVNDLWERMKNCYNTIVKQTRNESIAFDTLKSLLWLSLSLEDVENDKEIADLKLMSFDDLKNMIINYYDFALRENANSISSEAAQ